MPTDDWFFDWLENHQRLCRHRDWVAAEDVEFYVGWVRMFDELRISLREAGEVSLRLQVNRPPHPDRHPEAIRAQVADIRRVERDRRHGSRITSPLQDARGSEAESRSRDCPECGGDGWARRRWRSARMPFVLTGTLFCRCPLGRHREATDPERPLGPKRNYSDLQGLPELWDRSLDHPSWSREPLPAYHHAGEEGWYIDPGEVVAAELPADVVAALQRQSQRRHGMARKAPRSPAEAPPPSRTANLPWANADVTAAYQRSRSEAEAKRAAEALDPALIVLPEDEPGWF